MDKFYKIKFNRNLKGRSGGRSSSSKEIIKYSCQNDVNICGENLPLYKCMKKEELEANDKHNYVKFCSSDRKELSQIVANRKKDKVGCYNENDKCDNYWGYTCVNKDNEEEQKAYIDNGWTTEKDANVDNHCGFKREGGGGLCTIL